MSAPTHQPIRKVLISGAGDVSMISVIDSTISPPRARQVQIRPLYSGFSGADINMRRGVYPMQKKAPLTPGYCLAGSVVAVGAKCKGSWQVGQMVAAMTVYEAQSELVNLEEEHVVPVPRRAEGDDNCHNKTEYLVDPRSATAVMLDWATAYGLVEYANVRSRQRVFIHGMSGAVGWALFKLCLMRGAVVYGTASASKHELILSEGGNPFPYTDKKWMDEMKGLGGANVVFDALGFESWGESYEILHRKGGTCPLSSSSSSSSPSSTATKREDKRRSKSSGKDDDGGDGALEVGMLVGFGGNLQTFNTSNHAATSSTSSPSSSPSYNTAPRSQMLEMAKLLALNAKIWDPRSTHFWYISRDDKSFLPTVNKLFDLIATGKIEIPIKKVWDMEDIREAHVSWGKDAGVGSILVKVNDE